MPNYVFFGPYQTIPEPESVRLTGVGDAEVTLVSHGAQRVEITDDISWQALIQPADKEDVFPSRHPGMPLSLEEEEEVIRRALWPRLESYCNPTSTAEGLFFSLYCSLCLWVSGPLQSTPALIPGAWVNWRKPNERRSIEEPFQVDFVLKTSTVGTDSLVVVELDGLSHFNDWNEGDRGRRWTPSEEKIEEHVKKDRWLRKQGFRVCRIANSEVMSIAGREDARELFLKLLNDAVGSLPLAPQR